MTTAVTATAAAEAPDLGTIARNAQEAIGAGGDEEEHDTILNQAEAELLAALGVEDLPDLPEDPFPEFELGCRK